MDVNRDPAGGGPGTGGTLPGDAIDRALAAWRRERPDLRVDTVGVVARLSRVTARMAPEIEATLARFGLSRADLSVLAALRRAGPPYRLSQRRLMDDLGLTSGTVSVRVDRLERAGLVAREPDPADRRGVLVRLTDAGRDRFDAAAPEHLATQERLLSALDAGEREVLAGLLRKLLASLEPTPGPGGAPVLDGVALAPAPAAARMRRAVGLPERPGLLVERVEPGSPAAAAGLRQGDLVVSADGVAVRGDAALAAALTRAGAGGRPCRLGVVRGEAEREVVLHPARGPEGPGRVPRGASR